MLGVVTSEHRNISWIDLFECAMYNTIVLESYKLIFIGSLPIDITEEDVTHLKLILLDEV